MCGTSSAAFGFVKRLNPYRICPPNIITYCKRLAYHDCLKCVRIKLSHLFEGVPLCLIGNIAHISVYFGQYFYTLKLFPTPAS